MGSLDITSVSHTERIKPDRPLALERVTALSLLDATTANFALTSAVWLFDEPSRILRDDFDLSEHLRECLQLTLKAYPQWCGRLHKIDTVDLVDDSKTRYLPVHARRFGRIYAHYGTPGDPGVEFTVAYSDAELDKIHNSKRVKISPVWESDQDVLKQLLPPTAIDTLKEPNEPDESGQRKPLVAFQLTKLAGGFAIGAKVTHPLADITALVRFMKDWAGVSRALLNGEAPPALKPVFDPAKVDEQASGDINAEEADPGIMREAKKLPFERYDWWASSDEKCESPLLPQAFQGQNLRRVGKPMPWSEWDLKAPVSCRVVHFTPAQIDHLQKKATAGHSRRISKHDVLLGHVWSCIMRARNLTEDQDLVHCNLVYGLRPLFQLGAAFLGSPIVMTNVELSGAEVTDPENAASTARKIRKSLSQATDVTGMAAHLHSLAYEKSPQRIWQAFLGLRHILVTTWARAGVYEVDFGLGSKVRYVDGVVPLMDGNILIKEAPGNISGTRPVEAESRTWTDDGVDVTINLTVEAMERLMHDPLLLPMTS